MEQATFTQLSIEQLTSIINEAVQVQVSNLQSEGQTLPQEYLTVKNVTELLQVSTSTVNNWKRSGVLPSYQIGGRVYFKRTDIDNAFVQLKSDRHEI